MNLARHGIRLSSCGLLALAGACSGGGEGGPGVDAGQDIVGPDGGADASDALDAVTALDADVASDGALAVDADLALDGATSSDAAELDATLADAQPSDTSVSDDAQDAAQNDATFGDAKVCTGSAVDVVWAIDGSGSMLQHLPVFQTRLSDLQAGFSTAGVDARITVIAGAVLSSLLADACVANCELVFAEVQSRDALDVLIANFSRYQSRLRAGVRTDFMVSSDDNAQLPANTFRTQLTSLLGHPFTFHANVTDGQNGPCVGFGAGTVYQQLASETGGQYVPLCEQPSAATSQLLEGLLADATGCPPGG